MIINIPMPDYLIGILLFLIGMAGTLSILERSMIIRIDRTGVFKTKKWIYTRTERKDNVR